MKIPIIGDKWRKLVGRSKYRAYKPPPRDVLFDAAWQNDLRGLDNNTSKEILFDDETRERIGAFLEEKGLRYLPERAFESSFALAFEIVDQQIFRIAKQSAESERPDLPQILQPTVDLGEIGGYVMEILPRVQTDGVTTKHVEDLVTSLAKQDHIFWDPKIENVGLLSDGTPVVIDGGAVVPKEKMHKDFFDNAIYANHSIKTMQFVYENSDEEVPQELIESGGPENYFNLLRARDLPEYQWQKAQERHIDSLGLKKGEISGVFSNSDIEELRQMMGGETGVINRGLLDGANQHDLKDIAGRATDRYLADDSSGPEEKSWRDYLTEEFAEFKKRLSPQGRDNKRGR